jgi:hypothetical protein
MVRDPLQTQAAAAEEVEALQVRRRHQGAPHSLRSKRVWLGWEYAQHALCAWYRCSPVTS